MLRDKALRRSGGKSATTEKREGGIGRAEADFNDVDLNEQLSTALQ